MNSDLYFDGKLFISSKRAARISGYVNDYIGQLCRDGKIESRMVGRTWYVGLESLISHKNSYVSGTKSKPLFFYKNVSLLPALSQFEVKQQVVESVPLSVVSVTDIIVSDKPVLLLCAPKSFPIQNVVFDTTEKTESIDDNEAHVDLPLVRENRKIIFTAFSSKVFAFVFAFVISLSGFQVIKNIDGNLIQFDNLKLTSQYQFSKNSSASVFSVVRQNFDFTARVVYRVMDNAWSDTKNKIIVAVGGESVDKEVVEKVIATGPSKGLVVVPMSNVSDKSKTVNDIKRTFSDEVVVSPDEDESGVITPVFQDSKGDDYLYVLVPIKN